MTDVPKISPVPPPRPASLPTPTPPPRVVGSAPARTVKADGDTIRFDWYATSVSQIVSLNHGRKRVEAIVGVVITPGDGPGPTSLTFRRVPVGIPLTDGKPLHSGSINLLGATEVDQVMAMAPEANCNLEEGDCIAADFFGVMRGARGTVMIKVVERES